MMQRQGVHVQQVGVEYALGEDVAASVGGGGAKRSLLCDSPPLAAFVV